MSKIVGLISIFGDQKLKNKELLEKKLRNEIIEFEFMQFHNRQTKDILSEEGKSVVYFNMSKHQDRFYVMEHYEEFISFNRVVIVNTRSHEFINDIKPDLVLKWKYLNDIRFYMRDGGKLMCINMIKKPDGAVKRFLKKLLLLIPILSKLVQSGAEVRKMI